MCPVAVALLINQPKPLPTETWRNWKHGRDPQKSQAHASHDSKMALLNPPYGSNKQIYHPNVLRNNFPACWAAVLPAVTASWSRYRYLITYQYDMYIKCAYEEISLSVCISTCLCRVTYASPLLHQFIRQLVWYSSSIVSWNSGILRHTHAILKSQKFAHHSLVLHVGQNLGDTVNRRLQQSDFKSRECY